MAVVLAKTRNQPLAIEIVAFVILIGIVIGVLAGLGYVVRWLWRRWSGDEVRRASRVSEHRPTAFNCRLPRAMQSNQVYTCPLGHVWVSYWAQRHVSGRQVYDPNSPGPPPQKRVIREPDKLEDDGLKWRYDQAASSKAMEAASLEARPSP